MTVKAVNKWYKRTKNIYEALHTEGFIIISVPQ